ncbi:MAG: hypothetical protein LAT53_11975 [Idiomarina sp.]|nr:hypothetical protein [Idiomarina sp.]
MADILTTVSTAISLASRLREIGKNVEDAEFKNLLADLTIELAEAKLKIADLVSDNAALKEKLDAVTSAAGERCPSCNNRTFKIVTTRPHPAFGALGAKERDYKCSTCDFEESKLIES